MKSRKLEASSLTLPPIPKTTASVKCCVFSPRRKFKGRLIRTANKAAWVTSPPKAAWLNDLLEGREVVICRDCYSLTHPSAVLLLVMLVHNASARCWILPSIWRFLSTVLLYSLSSSLLTSLHPSGYYAVRVCAHAPFTHSHVCMRAELGHKAR